MNEHLTDGATKACVKCGKPAIFNRRTESNLVASLDRYGQQDPKAPAHRIGPGWTCSNPNCAYVEEISN